MLCSTDMLPLSPHPPTTRNCSSPLQLSLEDKKENIKIGFEGIYFIPKLPFIFPDELDQIDAKFCILFDCFFVWTLSINQKNVSKNSPVKTLFLRIHFLNVLFIFLKRGSKDALKMD